MATLAELMDAAGLAGPENELLKAQYMDALKKSRTPQPEAMQTRDMTVAASPVANIAATLNQIFGGLDSKSLMEAMSGNLRKQQDFRTAGAQAATQPGFDPGKAAYTFLAGGEKGMAGEANADEARLLKQTLLAQQNAARQKQIETTGGFKLTLGQMGEEGKDRRFTPNTGTYQPEKGGFILNKSTGTMEKIQPDPAALAAKNARATAAKGTPQLTYDEDGNAVLVDKATGGVTPVTKPDGEPLSKVKKDLSSKEIEGIRAYDAALLRVRDMRKMFNEGIGTYPGASLLHNAAAVVNAHDPRFDKLRALAQSHLLKGLKADVGGRITNFEIQYGKTMFPNENDRTDSALAKLDTVEQHLLQDKENAYKALEASGRKMGNLTQESGTQETPATTPAAEPPKRKKYNPATGQVE